MSAAATPDPTTAGARTIVLDNRRVPCATGLIRARRRMVDLAVGDVLEVVSHDRFAPYELPLWAERDGHEVLAIDRDGHRLRRVHRIAIRKRHQQGPAVTAPDRHRDGDRG